jgi:allophanate hydrolase subunit 2
MGGIRSKSTYLYRKIGGQKGRPAKKSDIINIDEANQALLAIKEKLELVRECTATEQQEVIIRNIFLCKILINSIF